jgi:hypothetical protein
MLKEFDLDEGKSISKEEFIAVLDDKYQKDAVRTAKWVKFLAKPPAKKEKKAPTDAPAAASSGADTVDKAALAKQPVGICHDDCSEFESVIAEVRAECRIAKCGFPTTVVVKDVPPVPEAELEAFKATHLSNEYLHGPEAEDRFKNDVKIQHTRWDWLCKNETAYVNVLRAAGHSEDNIQGVFDGRPLCWTSIAVWDEFRSALGELEGALELEKGWTPVSFVHTGSAVPGFSQNPCKGFRDLPSKITDPSKSDVDLCIVGDGVNDCFQKMQEEGELKTRIYPTTTGMYTRGSRFGVKGEGLASFSTCVSAFHEVWSARLPGGLQLTFAEDDQGIPPWEMYIRAV